MSKSVHVHKGLEPIICKSGMVLPHSSRNSTKLKGRILICLKCKEERTGGIKAFDNTKSYYFHLKTIHNNLDKNLYPKTDNCISMLQTVSDLISIGMIRQ